MAIALDIGLMRLVISLVLGGLIGFERELHKSPAGLRTISLVSVGATLYTLASLEFAGPNADVSRIAAQIVVGLGFIGGGVIFQLRDTIHGLTTAASIWIAGAIGLMVGIGDYMFASATTLMVVLVLWLGVWEKKALTHNGAARK
ncbi:MAG: MgtC/SapB family protein [Candidatus Woesearchaeota archaeon]